MFLNISKKRNTNNAVFFVGNLAIQVKLRKLIESIDAWLQLLITQLSQLTHLTQQKILLKIKINPMLQGHRVSH